MRTMPSSSLPLWARPLALASLGLLVACTQPLPPHTGGLALPPSQAKAAQLPDTGSLVHFDDPDGSKLPELLGTGLEVTLALALAQNTWAKDVKVGLGGPGAAELKALEGPASGGAAYALQGGNVGLVQPESGHFPYRHRYQGADRALWPSGGTHPPKPRRLAQSAAPRVLGSVDRFWVNTSMTGVAGDHQRDCVLKRVTEHAYLYVDQAAGAITEAQLDELSQAFERDMVPKETKLFGAIPKPGVDQEDRIFIVLSPVVDDHGRDKGMMGYFWSRDAIPGYPSHSNQKECLFMTDRLFQYPRLTAFGTLAHEFQHLLNFSRKAAANGYTQAEETWLDEGLSMYAMDVAGYGMQAGDLHVAKDLNEFQKAPELYSLTDWNGNPRGFAYGLVYLFVRYLADRHGEEAVAELLQGKALGVANVDSVLRRRGSDFNRFFLDWATANLLNDAKLSAGTPYRYRDLALNVAYGGFQLSGFKPKLLESGSAQLTMRPYGMAFFQVRASAQQAWFFGLSDVGANRLGGTVVLR